MTISAISSSPHEVEASSGGINILESVGSGENMTPQPGQAAIISDAELPTNPPSDSGTAGEAGNSIDVFA